MIDRQAKDRLGATHVSAGRSRSKEHLQVRVHRRRLHTIAIRTATNAQLADVGI